MATKVVDASAIASVLFQEAGHATVLAQLHGEHLTAPTLFSYEMGNVFLTKLRREPTRKVSLTQAFGELPAFRVNEREVDVSDCLKLAARFDLTMYDASYLWLSLHLRAELVTQDKKLARAAAASD